MLSLGPAIGIAITGATVGTLIIRFFRASRERPFPAHGWFGIVALGGAEWLLFRGLEPVPTYFTPIAWSAYILIADAAVFGIDIEAAVCLRSIHDKFRDSLLLL